MRIDLKQNFSLMSDEPSLLSVLRLPDVLLLVCAKYQSVFIALLGLCKTIREQIQTMECQLVSIYPHWGLQCLVPKPKKGSAFVEGDLEVTIFNKMFLPSGFADKLMPRWTLPDGTQLNHPQQLANVPELEKLAEQYTNRILYQPLETEFLGVAFKMDGIARYFWSSDGIYSTWSSDDCIIEKTLVSRNLSSLMCEIQVLLELALGPHGHLDDQIKKLRKKFCRSLRAKISRQPTWKYDFCSFCKGGKFSSSYSGECWFCPACNNQPFCSDCFKYKHPQHPLVNIMYSQRTPATINFCTRCNSVLENEPLSGFVCQHFDKSLCQKCAATFGREIANCRFDFNFALSRLYCDQCKRSLTLFESYKSCQACCAPDHRESYDLCLSCYEAKTEKQFHANCSKANWSSKLAMSFFCRGCENNIEVDLNSHEPIALKSGSHWEWYHPGCLPHVTFINGKLIN